MTQEANTPKEDFTKSRSYAMTDLFVKSISALAIVALGLAGWRLQNADQKTRHADEDRRHAAEEREVAERRYLPMLRSIMEVDFILVEVSADYTWPNHSDTEVTNESRLGSHLAYFASSLLFQQGEPTFDVVIASDNASAATDPKRAKISGRPAILMLAELMRLAPFFKRLDKPNVHVVFADSRLTFKDGKGAFVDSIAVDRETVPAWKAWFPRDGMTLHDLFYEVDLDALAHDLHDQLRAVADGVVKEHADVLSSEYVKIRDDVMKSRNDLLPVTK